MNHARNKKRSQILIEELTKRSRKGLEFAKKSILAEKIEQEKLCEALMHYVSKWNDFVHPGFFSIAHQAVGGDSGATEVQVQAALATIAGALDIHDDVIDNSKMKHGMPTVFGKFGKDVAILLGNAFLIEGISLLNKSIELFPQEKRREILETFKKLLFEVGNAHALELNLKEKFDVAPEECLRIISMKAASFEADMRIGAIVGGGTMKEISILTRYGRILGILATLREEFVDTFAIEELNQRVASEYLPLPVLYAMQNEKAKESVVKIFANGNIRTKDVDELVDLVFKAAGVIKLKKRMKEFVHESVEIVSKLENLKLEAYLKSLASTFLEDI
jgi:geranylgeranyl pyrophosphate synthase